MLERWADKSRLGENLKNLINRQPDNHRMYTCDERCNKTSRDWNDISQPKCFCDDMCVAFKDCCHDYEKKCGRPSVIESRESVEDICTFRRSHSTPYGFIFKRTCPDGTAHALSQRCSTVRDDDYMSSLPVIDVTSRTPYRNLFCAVCRKADEISWWRAEAVCPNSTIDYTNMSKVRHFIASNCTMRYSPSNAIRDLHPICIPPLTTPIIGTPSSHVTENVTEIIKEFCDSYAFPVCVITNGVQYMYKNPHCVLQSGQFDLSDVKVECGIFNPSLPPLSIFFDFRSTTSYVMSERRGSGASDEVTEETLNCLSNQVYDPFAGRCREVFAGSLHPTTGSPTSGSNCTYVALDEKEYKFLENGTILVEAHHRRYSNSSYKIINGTLYVCTNFTQEYNVLPSGAGRGRTHDLNALSALTIAGCALSMISLVVLIFSYAVLPELRNLPGRVVLSLAITMLLYHLLYFLVNQSDTRALCVAVAVSLHFALLSAFCWMNVLAFDVHHTFTKPGQRRTASRGHCPGTYAIYAAYSWGIPLAIVTISFSVDLSGSWRIGYGRGEYCFIENPSAMLYLFLLPVAIILLYNFIALFHTMWHIRAVRKKTSKASNQQRKPNLPIICFKMTSAMGITWVLAYFASTQATSFLWYAFVILNSLQGFLILLSYVLNRRVLSMYRETLQSMRKTSTQGTRSTTPGRDNSLAVASTTEGGRERLRSDTIDIPAGRERKLTESSIIPDKPDIVTQM
ncbi:predicted protein [Nematostella vectensis]|uniref:Uncharacterized protein n=1 Tax=Nematostella vectensis TaxID=45351 RepID=A7SPE2_NEMVE|nr:predicted protein [Nematostella vectensis]|eukprot:XP_001626520.1 predicted protein [Nematostella vectensis]